VQAYLQGVLVGQVTGQSGLSLCSFTKITQRLDFDWALTPDGWWYTVCTLGWNTAVAVAFTGLPAVTADHLAVIPENERLGGAPTAFQVTASGVPALTITGENETLMYQGLANTTLGNASETIACCVSNLSSGGQDGLTLVVSNLGSSGQDGVSIALPTNSSAIVVHWQPSGGADAMPVGAYVQSQIVGTFNGLVSRQTNDVMGVATVTKAGTANYQYSVDFSPVGVTTYIIQAYLQGVLVGQVTNYDGPVGWTTNGPGPSDTEYVVEQVGSWVGTNWVWNNVWLPKLTFGWVGGAAGPFTFTNDTSSFTVIADHLAISPADFTLESAPTAFQLVAASVSALTITNENESLVYQGRNNTTLGNATESIACCVSNLSSGGQDGLALVVTNLGSSGQDGLAIAMNGNESFEADFAELDPGNALPNGAQLTVNSIGTTGSVTNGLLGSLQVTKVGTSNYAVSANFPASPTNTVTVSVYNQGTLVASQSGLPAYEPIFHVPHFQWDIEFYPCPLPFSRIPYPCDPVWCPFWPWCHGIFIQLTWHYYGPYYVTLGGQAVLGDTVTVSPDVETASTFTGVQLLASGIPQITLTDEVGTANFTQLQVLLPGETNAPNTTTGKTGSPTPVSLESGVGTTVTVLAVDAQWNPVPGVTDTISISSSDGGAILPGSETMVNGSAQFTLDFGDSGSWTVTAADVTSTSILPNTSSQVTVDP
jgi:hypothetical protein